MNRPPKVLVMGGGISGLSTAWWLSQSGIPVEVWERDTSAAAPRWRSRTVIC